jgi:hypothetical protein
MYVVNCESRNSVPKINLDGGLTPIYGGGGMHRFAMAKILNLEIIPAQLGVVHRLVIDSCRGHKVVNL